MRIHVDGENNGARVAELSVVLISHNQAWNITRLIQSVLAEVGPIGAHEIILVDSASTDNTVQVAKNFPIRILKMHSTQPLSSHAGRYVGFKQSTGRLILFLDGDMELYEGWLTRAITRMENSPDVAVVDGPRIDVPLATKSHDEVRHVRPAPDYKDRNGWTETEKVGGAALYRRSVLDRVGPFNPWFRSGGEPELCLRIRHAGFRVIQIHHPAIYHYSDPPREWGTVIGRWKRGMYVGTGQIMRFHLGQDLFWPYVKKRGYGVVPLIYILAGIVALLASLVLSQPIWIVLWALPLIMMVGYDLAVRRRPVRTFSSLLERLCHAEGTVRGFIMEPQDPADYPGTFDEVV